MRFLDRFAASHPLAVGVIAAIVTALLGLSALLAFTVWSGMPVRLYTLAGGLFAAGGTVVAGWLAWRGIREEIEHQRELADRTEKQAMQALRDGIADLFAVLDEIWFGVDIALDTQKGDVERRRATTYAIHFFPVLPTKERLNELEELGTALGPLKRHDLGRLMKFLRLTVDHMKEVKEEAPTTEWSILEIRMINLRVLLSHVAYAWHRYDPDQPWFVDKQKDEVREQPFAHFMRESRETWIAQHGPF